MLVSAGLCCLVAASWYAARVVNDFNDPFYGGMKYVHHTDAEFRSHEEYQS